MKDFDRLVETSPHALTRELLDAGLDDAPAPSAAPRVAAALGLSAGVAGAAAPALAATSLGSGAVAGGASSLGAAMVLQWLGMGLLAGTVVSGGAALVRRNPAQPAKGSVTSTAAATQTAAARVRAETSRRAAAVPPSPLRATPPPARSTPRSSGAAPVTSAAPVGTLPEQASALAHEVARIDEARVALRSGDAQAALAALDRYDEERRTGALDRESAVLRIEALRFAGKAAEAQAHARRYLERFPSDAHAASLRELLRESGRAPGIDR